MNKVEYMKDCNEGLQVLLIKMFDIVGAPHDLPLVDDWYAKYEWTEEQEAEFKEFFLDFVKSHPKRKDVISSLCRKKKDRETAWQWFNLMYSWKSKEVV